MKYCLEKTVCWNNVLKVLRWHLSLRVDQYYKLISLYKSDGFSKTKAWGMCRELLKESYENYRQVRAFLGYTHQTKLEEKALRLLSCEQKNEEIE